MKQISEAFGRRLKDTGVTRIQWIAMYYVYRHQIISQRELSILMNVKDSSAGRLLDQLERNAMISRIQSKTDRRVTLIELTDNGRALFDKILPYGDAFNNELTNGIDQAELIVFERVLDQMINNINETELENHKLL